MLPLWQAFPPKILLPLLQILSLLLFKVLSDRSEQSSTIVSTNLPFSRWTELFEHPAMVSALVDRLTYRSHVLDMSGPSYRLLTTQSETKKTREENTEGGTDHD